MGKSDQASLRYRLNQRMTPLRERATNRWRSFSPATQALPSVFYRAVINFLAHGGTRASSLAYYALFSLFPLILLIAIGFSRLIGPALTEQQISLGLAALLPPSATEALSAIQINVQQALEQSGSFTLVAIIGLGWSGLGLFSGITGALDVIFQTPIRNIWRARLTALIMAFALLGLLLLSFVSSAVIRLLSSLLFSQGSFWLTIGALFLPIGLNLLIFILLFRYVPARRMHWDAIWPAALFGAVLWEIAKFAFGWYLTNMANFQFVYGTLATGIILLFWAYLIASIFLISAELCAGLNQWYFDFFVAPEDGSAGDDLPTLQSPENRQLTGAQD